MKITDAPVKFNAGPKIPTAADAAKHKVNLIHTMIDDWIYIIYRVSGM